jgi:hypothetical protein
MSTQIGKDRHMSMLPLTLSLLLISMAAVLNHVRDANKRIADNRCYHHCHNFPRGVNCHTRGPLPRSRSMDTTVPNCDSQRRSGRRASLFGGAPAVSESRKAIERGLG